MLVGAPSPVLGSVALTTIPPSGTMVAVNFGDSLSGSVFFSVYISMYIAAEFRKVPAGPLHNRHRMCVGFDKKLMAPLVVMVLGSVRVMGRYP